MAMLQQTPIGRSDAFHKLMDRVSDAAALDRTVLIVGERGTGKELIASRLHFLSPRWEQVFISVNCAAYNEEQLDALLFGQSFHDGSVDIDGQFVRADGGTLFLNNIEFVSTRLQEKMLQAFEQGVVDPLGSPDTAPVNVRLLAAAGRDLRLAVKEGAFRLDLLEHLTFDIVSLPPLRERIEDIFALTEHFGRKMAVNMGAESFGGFSPDAMALLARQNWPGNVRELRAVIERSVGQAFLADETLSQMIDKVVLNPFDGISIIADKTQSTVPIEEPITETVIDGSLEAPLEGTALTGFHYQVMAFERRLIDKALNDHSHHQGQASESLDLSYHAFRGLLRKHGLKK